jgi:hypothetical protein
MADVYAGRRARWPIELVLLKVLRQRQDADLFDNEWNALQTLQKSAAPGVDTFTMLIPQPIIHGDLTGGAFAGRRQYFPPGERIPPYFRGCDAGLPRGDCPTRLDLGLAAYPGDALVRACL